MLFIVSFNWPLKRVRSVRCPALSARSRPCGASSVRHPARPHPRSGPSLPVQRLPFTEGAVTSRDARRAGADEMGRAQQASAHRKLTTTMRTSWGIAKTSSELFALLFGILLYFCVVPWLSYILKEIRNGDAPQLGFFRGTCWFCATVTIWMWSILWFSMDPVDLCSDTLFCFTSMLTTHGRYITHAWKVLTWVSEQHLVVERPEEHGESLFDHIGVFSQDCI